MGNPCPTNESLKTIFNDEEAPTYLRDILPNTAEDRSGYTLRSGNNCTNDLSNDLRPCQTFFKRKVRSQQIQVMDYLLVGERKTNIVLTGIRHMCSSLNEDLLKVNIVPYSNC